MAEGHNVPAFSPYPFYVFWQVKAKVRISKTLSEGEKSATASRKEEVKKGLAKLGLQCDVVGFHFMWLSCGGKSQESFTWGSHRQIDTWASHSQSHKHLYSEVSVSSQGSMHKK